MKVILAARAEKALLPLNDQEYLQVIPVIDSMGINLTSLKKKKLHGFISRWRIRVGEGRSIYDDPMASDEVVVLEIVRRKDAYR